MSVKLRPGSEAEDGVMKRSLWRLLALAVPVCGVAGTPVQASMLVTGTITVNPRGGVASFSIRDIDKLPPAARNILQATIPHWVFAPVMQDGKPVSATAGMAVRIEADFASADAKQGTVRVVAANFGCEARPKSRLPGECPPGTSVMEDVSRRQRPRYPIDALRAHLGGEVFLVLEIGRDGRVAQAAAQQVNLYERTDQSAYYRKVLADSALRAAHHWQFRPPTAGPNAAKQHWIVTIPINYAIGGPGAARRRKAYGHWDVYVPGPLQTIPWDHQHHAGGDAVAGGAPFVQDKWFVLETPLGSGAGRS